MKKAKDKTKTMSHNADSGLQTAWIQLSHIYLVDILEQQITIRVKSMKKIPKKRQFFFFLM